MGRKSLEGTTAIICDFSGEIRQILQEGCLPGSVQDLQTPDAVILDRDIGKYSAFLQEVLRQGMSFDWWIRIKDREEVTPYLFSGIAGDQTVLLLADEGPIEVEEIVRHLKEKYPGELHGVVMPVSNGTDNEDQHSRIFGDLMALNNEFVKIQKELSIKNDYLEKLNKYKNHLISVAASDLKPPISLIRNLSQRILENKSEDWSHRDGKYLRQIHDASGHLLELSNDLIEISNMVAGKMELDIREENLSRLIDRAVEKNKMVAADKEVKMIPRLEREDVELMFDQKKIEQVVNNLLHNAIRHAPENSDVTVSLEIHGSEAVVSVKDEGPGLPNHEVNRIFHSSLNTGRGKSSNDLGGLGLNIVSQIVIAHRGQLWVESDEGKGSEFFFSLPLTGPASGK